MSKKIFKRILSMTLIATLLIQILPATAKGAEIDTTATSELSITQQTGLSDIYEYQTYDAGRAGTINVNTYTGKMHLRRTDMSLSGERMPMEVAFYFDTVNGILDSPYGRFWKNIYNQTLNFQGGVYKYKNENGTYLYFENSGEVTEDGLQIWTEQTTYGIGDTGAVLYRPSDVTDTNYAQVYISRLGEDYHFDSRGRLTRISNEYDEINIEYLGVTEKIDCIEDSAGRKFVFYYSGNYLTGIYAENADGERIENTEVTYRFDEDNLQGVIYGGSHDVTYGYSGNTVNRVADIDGCGYEFTYSSSKKVTSVVQKADMGKDSEESGATITIAYPQAAVTQITSETTRQVYNFDGCGRVTRNELQYAVADSSDYATVYGYINTYGYYTDEDGKEVNGLVDTEYFIADGIIEEGEDGGTSTVVTEEIEEQNYVTNYDNYGNLIKDIHTENGLQQITEYAYDSDGNYLVSVTDADGYTESYQYDEKSDDIAGITDKNGNTTQFEYNGLRELSLATMEVSGLVKARIENLSVQFTEGPDEISVGYEYEDGRLTSVHYGESVYVFTYDKWGNMLTVTMDGSTLVTYDYGTEAYKGLPQIIGYGSSKIYYTYDHLDRVSTVGYTQNNPRYEYSYSADGNLTTVYNKSKNLTTKYTENGYQIYRGTPDSVTEILYEYNDGEENCSESILGQTLTYTVETDENFSWLKAADEAGILVYSEKTEYDAFDRLEEKTLNVGSLEVSQSYDYIIKDNTTGNRVSDYTIRYNHGESTQNISFSYTYDGNGNITSVEELCNGTSYRTEYTYDEAGQLKTVFDEKTGAQYGYCYDEYGNIVYEELYHIDSSGNKVLEDWVVYTYEGMELVRSNSYANGVINYVTNANSMIIQMAEPETSIALSWGDGRCLKQIREYNNNWTAGYTYNEQGLRIGKRISGEGIVTKEWEYVWGQNGLAGFTQGENTVLVHYGQDGTPVGFSLNDTMYTYIKNIQGDVLRILDTTGNTVVEYSYDPWGVPTVTGDTELAAINPCSYRGYDYDEESGFYYLQSRYYDPAVGRFISPDEIDFLGASGNILGYNLFAYCENNPVNYTDLWGYIRINVKWVDVTVNIILRFIPMMYTISKIWRTVSKSAGKLADFGDKLVPVWSTLLKRLDDRLYCACAKESTYRTLKTIGVLAGIVSIVCSVGDVVEYIIDILDGKWDGYIDTNRYGPKFDLSRDY